MQLLQTLLEIANKVRLESSNFRISYSGFPPLEVPIATVAQLQKMPQEIQDESLNLLLRNLIYEIHYEGSLVEEVSQRLQTNDQTLKKIASTEVDWEFYEQLERNNKSKGWFHPDYHVLRQEADGSLAVKYDGVTLHIQRNRHLKLEEQLATVNDSVSVLMPSRSIEWDLYTTIGEAETDASTWKDPSNQVVFAYFNFAPEAAIIAMKHVTTRLNEIKLPFAFKVLHNPLNYKGYNSGFIQFHRSNYEVIRQLLQIIYAETKSHFQEHVPIFTKVLAPGIGLAEHPHPKVLFKYSETFGWNRCQIVANALLEAHKNGDESKEARMKYILQHFDYFKIDLERPYLNPDSEDIYTPLEVV
ncbi:MAG: T3SS effector HopA1 family protein [Nostoc sp.]|uniref:T3SS effector HopA1 family protein n=1 Tax=Nostoc sp. TaxID=1180 RepID=UPI002FFA62EB